MTAAGDGELLTGLDRIIARQVVGLGNGIGADAVGPADREQGLARPHHVGSALAMRRAWCRRRGGLVARFVVLGAAALPRHMQRLADPHGMAGGDVVGARQLADRDVVGAGDGIERLAAPHGHPARPGLSIGMDRCVVADDGGGRRRRRTLTRGRIALPDRALRLGGRRRIALPGGPRRRRQRTLPERAPLHAFGADRAAAGRDRIGIHGRIVGKALHRT